MNIDESNEGYDPGNENLVFHYNRNERLQNAPQNVKDYYDGKMNSPAKGLFRTLVSTKTNRWMFGGMILCCLIVAGVFFVRKNASDTVEGVPVQVSAFTYLESVYVNIKLSSVDKKYVSAVPVEILLHSINTDKAVAETETVSGVYEGHEVSLGAVLKNYDIVSVEAYVTVNNEKKKIVAYVHKS